MASRGPLDPRCGIARSLDLLGERWALLVVREALLGHTRFSQFRARLGLSPDVLTARLESLVAAGVLERSTYREDGARERVEYLLTDAGRDLSPVLAALAVWGDEHDPHPDGAARRFSVAGSGEPVRVAFVTGDGREVEPADVEMVPRAGD
ncbi:winged helix-turn-helix transcriptional regulator [Frigoribacterium sp. NPDC087798]|uniref:winged helix-turn-helix transcriptional regulator n=1 Tax=Frigoribacterium sp. NPDC087798 TaxID=3363993 RepID=UPI003826B98A